MARAANKHIRSYRRSASAEDNEISRTVPFPAAISSRITPVLLAGGGGSRLWPLSGRVRPKQLLRLIGSYTLLQDTVLRFVDPELFGPVTVVANHQHRAAINAQFAELGLAVPSTVLEPVGRGTAAPAAIAALLAMERDPTGLLLLCPSDHAISDTSALRTAIRDGAALAQEGHFVLFGVPPTAPSTSYGYICPGSVFAAGNSRVREITAFFEKPDARTAEAYVRSGMLWNSGMFLVRATTLLTELARHASDIVEDCQDALSLAAIEGECVMLESERFARCRSVSLDVAVIEQLTDAVVVALDAGWADLGSWSSVWDRGDKDSAGNSFVGNVIGQAAEARYVRSEGPLVVALGVSDLVIVATQDAILVTTLNGDQAVRKIPDLLADREREAQPA